MDIFIFIQTKKSREKKHTTIIKPRYSVLSVIFSWNTSYIYNMMRCHCDDDEEKQMKWWNRLNYESMRTEHNLLLFFFRRHMTEHVKTCTNVITIIIVFYESSFFYLQKVTFWFCYCHSFNGFFSGGGNIFSLCLWSSNLKHFITKSHVNAC